MIRKVIERVMPKYEITPESVPEEVEIVNPSIPENNYILEQEVLQNKGICLVLTSLGLYTELAISSLLVCP